MFGTIHFKLKTKWLWLGSDIVTTIKSDKVLCRSFGLYPCYAAGILNSEGNSFLRVV